MGNPATRSWLTRHLQLWHEKVPYDGLWLDMNEASNFCSGVQCVPDTANETAMYCE
jgi:alpha-glucosidase (family GH31 glycosyl hydrolase)